MATNTFNQLFNHKKLSENTIKYFEETKGIKKQVMIKEPELGSLELKGTSEIELLEMFTTQYKMGNISNVDEFANIL